MMAITSCTNPTTPSTNAPPANAPSPTSRGAVATTGLPAGPADIVLHNGHVITVDDAFRIAEAVAISDGDIVAVGSSADLLNLVGDDTVVVDLEGMTVVPGFVDPHTHALQQYGFAADLDAMRAAQRDLLSGGVTSTGAPNVKPDELEAFRALEAAGDVIIRNHLYLSYNDECGERPFGDYSTEHTFRRAPELRQTIAGVKVFADGGVCNAPAFSQPYPATVPDRLKEAGFVGTGSLDVTVDEVAEVADRVDAAGGITVVHAIGDTAIQVALQGLAAANQANRFTNPQRIDHNSASSLLPAEVLALYGQLGMVPVVFPVPWANGCDPAVSDAWRAILPSSAFGVIENSAALRAANPGMRISWHGDAPSVPGHPLQLLYTLITGGAVDPATGQVCRPEAWAGFHVVDIEEGLRMLTINAAAAMGIDERVGSIEAGKVADLLVLERDPLGPDTTAAIAGNRPLITMIDGVVQFCEGDPCEAFGRLVADPGSGSASGIEVTASAFRDVHTPDLVLDGSAAGDSFWSSGADGPGWIQLRFPEPIALASLRLTVFQSPPSDTVHVVEIMVAGAWSEATVFRQFTTTGDVLEWAPKRPVSGVEAVRITTTRSLSWPEWYEIAVVPAE